MAVKQLRLNKKLDGWVRAAVEDAKALADADYAAISKDLGKNARWAQNAFSRGGTLQMSHARALMDWAEAVTEKYGDRKSLSQVRFVKAHLRDSPRTLSPVPLLVLSEDIDRVAKAFDKYLDQKNRTSAKGLLRDFLVRPALVGSTPNLKDSDATYARACAWDLSWRVRNSIGARARSVSITDEGRKLTVSPDDVRTLIYGLDHLVALDKLPRTTRSTRRKARRAPR